MFVPIMWVLAPLIENENESDKNKMKLRNAAPEETF